MEAALSALPNWAALGGSAGVGFFMVKWFVEWLGGRVDKREAAADAGMEKLIKHLQDQIDRQAGEMNRLVDRVASVERDLAECREKHAEAQAEVMKLQAKIQGLGDARQQAAAIVASERVMDRTVAQIVDKTAEKKG